MPPQSSRPAATHNRFCTSILLLFCSPCALLAVVSVWSNPPPAAALLNSRPLCLSAKTRDNNRQRVASNDGKKSV